MSLAAASKDACLEAGSRIFAKVRGYPAWPARVESVADDKRSKFNVFFFGTYESAVVKRDDIYPFNDENVKKFGNQKRKYFSEAMHEIVECPDMKTREQLIAIAGEEDETDHNKPSDVVTAVEVSPVVTPTLCKVEETTETEAQSSNVNGPVKSVAGKRRRTIDAAAQASPPVEAAVGTAKSRSGRVIKRKKFDSDDEATPPVDGSKSAPRGRRSLGTPVTTSNASVITKTTDSSEILNDVTNTVVVECKEQDQETPAITAYVTNNLQELQMLRAESRIVLLDLNIKKALHITRPKMDSCIKHLDDFTSTLDTVTSLMLKKQPQIVTTLRKLRKYVGPKIDAHNAKVSVTVSGKKSNEWREQSRVIREKADALFANICTILGLSSSDESVFHNDFNRLVDAFREATGHLEQCDYLSLVEEPNGQLQTATK